MAAKNTPIGQAPSDKKRSASAVEKLVSLIQEWAEEQGWWTDRKTKVVSEAPGERREFPELFIRTPQARLVVNPIGLDIVGADGRVDIETFPSMHRFVLIFKDEAWHLFTDSYVEWPNGWSKKEFFAIVGELEKAA
jgi:hypothetical protein